VYYNGGIKLEKKNTKKLELPISSKTGEPLKPFIKPGGALLLGITFIVWGVYYWWAHINSWGTLPALNIFSPFFLVEGNGFFMLFMGFVFSIILWSTPGLLYNVMGIIIIITFTLGSIILCLYWPVKLEKYKVKN
jgi:hypothetical protein